jgi:hypothetical protein
MKRVRKGLFWEKQGLFNNGFSFIILNAKTSENCTHFEETSKNQEGSTEQRNDDKHESSIKL